jgi:3-oxoacyl-[acyl-carrier-protein] synthase III
MGKLTAKESLTMPNIIIESFGVYLPDRTVSTQEVIKSCQFKIGFPLERVTGIKSRRMAGENEFSVDLARKSISRCLEFSKYYPKDIELLICCNISRLDKVRSFTCEPSTAIQLKRDFDFQKARCFDINNACAGMFTAIHIVDAFIKSGLAKRALVVSGEYITHLTETAHKEISGGINDERLACLTLGDAGAAIILEESPNSEVGFKDLEIFTLGRYSDLCVSQPSTEPHGGCIMNTQSVKLHRIAAQAGIKYLVKKLKSRTWRNPINHFVPHQTARIVIRQGIKGINQLLGTALLNSWNTIDNLKQRGNTASTAHFVALWDKILDSTINSKDTALFGIAASGITLGVAEYTFDELPDRIRNRERQVKIDTVVASNGSIQTKKRIAFRALGIALHSGGSKADSVGLATNAIRSCLKEDGCAPEEVGLLINSGVYRNDFIGEPAMATVIAGQAQLNATYEGWDNATTLAYDLGNGACGFVHACWTVQAMVASGKTKKALCVSSEIDNNKTHAPNDILDLKECGVAALLEESSRAGFMRFLFKYYPEYQEAFRTEVNWENGKPFLKISRKPDWEFLILEHVGQVIEELLAQENLAIDDIQIIIPPQVSGGFVQRFLIQQNLPESKVVNLNDGQNYHTCSTVFGLKHAFENGMVREGDLGIILEAGSGLMLAAALYQF